MMVGEEKRARTVCRLMVPRQGQHQDTTRAELTNYIDKNWSELGCTLFSLSLTRSRFPPLSRVYSPSGSLARWLLRSARSSKIQPICGAEFNHVLPVTRWNDDRVFLRYCVVLRCIRGETIPTTHHFRSKKGRVKYLRYSTSVNEHQIWTCPIVGDAGLINSGSRLGDGGVFPICGMPNAQVMCSTPNPLLD